ncbi:SprT-like domain-containing protein [Acidithiobacillus thiooxidans]|uniref:SprT-like domain-containing protein n=1 Tax=Acidithiobacillus thiooxidans TaxID=930 RepID=UPI00068C702D|nr:SprT-like domain-containing protein [Acidithiobacillus thiooxidans]
MATVASQVIEPDTEQNTISEGPVDGVPVLLGPTEQAYGELQSAFDHFNKTLIAPLLGRALPPCLITLQRERRTRGYFSRERFVGIDGETMVDEIAMNPSYFSITSIDAVLSTLVHEMVHGFQFHFASPGRGRYHNKEWADLMEKIGLMPSSTGRVGGRRVGEHMTHYIIEGGPFAQSCEALVTQAFRLSWIDRYPPVDPTEFSDDYADLDDRTDLDNDDRTTVRYSVPPLGPVDAGQPDNDASGSEDGGTAFVGPPAPPTGMLRRKAAPSAPMTPPSGIVYPSSNPKKSTRAKYRCPNCGMQLWGKPGLAVVCGDEGCGYSRLDEVQA